MYNCVNFSLSIIATVLSFQESNNPNYLLHWVIAALISTGYSYFWDICQDWGFFSGNDRKLINNKSYRLTNRHKCTVTVVDGLFRCTWIFTISNVMLLKWFRDKMQVIHSVICMVEIVRRCIWNHYRVRNEFLNIELARAKSCMDPEMQSPVHLKKKNSSDEELKAIKPAQKLSLQPTHHNSSESPNNLESKANI